MSSTMSGETNVYLVTIYEPKASSNGFVYGVCQTLDGAQERGDKFAAGSSETDFPWLGQDDKFGWTKRLGKDSAYVHISKVSLLP